MFAKTNNFTKYENVSEVQLSADIIARIDAILGLSRAC